MNQHHRTTVSGSGGARESACYLIATADGTWASGNAEEAKRQYRAGRPPVDPEMPAAVHHEDPQRGARLRWLRPVMIYRGACGCKAGETSERTPIYAWPWLRVRNRIIGARWYGWPWPLRLRWRGVRMRVTDVRRWQWPIFVKQMPGCGCIKLLKDGWLRLWKIKRRLI